VSTELPKQKLTFSLDELLATLDRSAPVRRARIAA
jgi:hypothetical protein